MILHIEQLIVSFLFWFYQQPALFGLICLGTPALVCIILQFQTIKSRSLFKFLPGILGLAFFSALIFHLFSTEKALRFFMRWQEALLNPHTAHPIPIVEFIFDFFVGTAGYRSLHQEIIFIALFSYFLFFLRHSWLQYRTTNVLLGDFSLKAFKRALTAGSDRPIRSKSNELGSADLAETAAIAAWTKPSGKPADTILKVTELRGSEGVAFQTANLVIPRDQRNRHMLIVAKTGGGKTTKFILPVLYNDIMCRHSSTVVIDSKPEMWGKLAGLTRKYNPEKRILLFNPLDTARSMSWNLLGKIRDDTDAKLIADTIIRATDQPTAKSDSPFFRNNALSLLNALMVGLLHDPNDNLSMPRVHELVQCGVKELCAWLQAHPEAYRTTRTFVDLVQSGSQNADTVMSELSMRISAWDLKAIRATTWTNELDLELLISEPTLFIIELRESEVEMLRPMANVIVVEILRYLTKRAEEEMTKSLPRPVGLVIDEFASALGRLPDIHVKLNTLRSRNVSIVAAIQSISQVKANYNDDSDSVLAGFSTKVFMPPLDNQDAEWASKQSGQMTIRFQTSSSGSNRKIIEWFASKNDGLQEQVQQRAVLTPDEVSQPKDNICTFFLPNMPAFQGHLVPHYQQPEMLKRINESEQISNFQLRDAPIQYEENLPAYTPGSAPAGAAAPGAVQANGLPVGITNTAGWTDQQVRDALEKIKKEKLDWENTTGSARKWWEAFENENLDRLALVFRLGEELSNRTATITEFFLAYVYSNTDNIQANLHYLDYSRLKKEEEQKKRDAEAAAQGIPAGAAPAENFDF
jgi:type IV secretory pathway TraG/TraD family ATPase VirD4